MSHLPTLSLFVLVNLVCRRVLVYEQREDTIYDKRVPNCHLDNYLSLTMFLLNAIIAKNMLAIINKLIVIKPKLAILSKE